MHNLTVNWICVGRVFCKKGCDSDADTWEECKLLPVITITFSLMTYDEGFSCLLLHFVQNWK